MTKLSDNYESFIASLIKDIKKTGRNIKNIGFGKKNFLNGKSGQKHQIDVSFIDYSFSNPTIVLIECKRWNQPIDVSIIKILKYNMDDILKNPESPNIGKMIVVTTSDFQSGAKKLARHENIIIQIVNHGPPYGFDYENIIQRGLVDRVKVSDRCEVVVIEAKKNKN